MNRCAGQLFGYCIAPPKVRTKVVTTEILHYPYSTREAMVTAIGCSWDWHICGYHRTHSQLSTDSLDDVPQPAPPRNRVRTKS